MEGKEKKTFTDLCRQKLGFIINFFAKIFLKLGLTANMMTILGCMGHIIAFWLIYNGKFLASGILLFLFACFDVVDGTMARMSNDGKGTEFGAVLDSVTDRISEFLCLAGIIMYYSVRGETIWVAVCLVTVIGSFLVPYTRAKGELYGLDMRLGILTRVERYLVLVISLLVGYPNIGMAIIAVFSNITALQRMIHIKKNLDSDQREQKDGHTTKS